MRPAASTRLCTNRLLVPVAERDGIRIGWAEQGDGVPLVLVTGVGGAGSAWWRLLRHLPPTVRAITLDNRGTGASDPVAGRFFGLDDLAGDVVAVMDAAGIARAHVMGSSLGGIVAQHLALEHRHRVASLILASTTGAGFRGGPPWRLLGAGALRPLVGAARSEELLASALYAAATLREHPERVTEDATVRDAAPLDPRTVAAQLLAVAPHNALPRLWSLAGMRVTVLHGAQDAVVSPDRARELAAAIPAARLVIIEGCGHAMTTDAEEATADAVLEHLACHGTASSSRAA